LSHTTAQSRGNEDAQAQSGEFNAYQTPLLYPNPNHGSNGMGKMNKSSRLQEIQQTSADSRNATSQAIYS